MDTLVKLDSKRFQQILLNLVSNAIKFSNKDGQVIVQVKMLSKGANESFDKLLVSVIDSGIGIKKKNQGKLFKLYGSIKS